MSREYTFGGALHTTSTASAPSPVITRARRALRSSLSSLARAETAARITIAMNGTMRRDVFFMSVANLQSSIFNVDHLSRIHPVVGIERPLQRPHDIERGAVLRLEVLHLSVADPVLARARAVHRERPLDHALVQPASLGHLARLRRIGHLHDG